MSTPPPSAASNRSVTSPLKSIVPPVRPEMSISRPVSSLIVPSNVMLPAPPPLTTKLVPLAFESDTPVPNRKVPFEPLVMSTPASPPFIVAVPLKLYVPSALLNWRPVPPVAFSVPVLKVSVPVAWLTTLSSALPLA
jgi:hypothetical protein